MRARAVANRFIIVSLEKCSEIIYIQRSATINYFIWYCHCAHKLHCKFSKFHFAVVWTMTNTRTCKLIINLLTMTQVSELINFTRIFTLWRILSWLLHYLIIFDYFTQIVYLLNLQVDVPLVRNHSSIRGRRNGSRNLTVHSHNSGIFIS